MGIKTDYRPAKLSEIVGHKVMKETLANQFRKNCLSKGYIFKGKTGGGKTTTARALAASINCEHRLPNGDACCTCDSCRSIIAGSHPDVREIAAADNNGVEMARELSEEVMLAPLMGEKKVYILDECHMLTKECWNNLLKTIEDAPAHSIFMFCTTEYEKVPETIRNRCTVFDFGPLAESDVAEYVAMVARQEHRQITKEACDVIAKYCDGSMRNALSLLEKTLSYKAEGEITSSDVLTAVGTNHYAEYFGILDGILTNSPNHVVNVMAEYASACSLEPLPAILQDILADAIMYRAGAQISGWDEYISHIENMCAHASLADLIAVSSAMLDLINTRDKSRAVVFTGILAIIGKVSAGKSSLVKEPEHAKALSAACESDTPDIPETKSDVSAEEFGTPDRTEPLSVMQEPKTECIEAPKTPEPNKTTPRKESKDESKSSDLPAQLNGLRELSAKSPLLKWLMMPQHVRVGITSSSIVIHTPDSAIATILRKIAGANFAEYIEIDEL